MFSHSTAVPYSTKHFCLPVFTSCHDFHFHISFSASTHYALIQFSCTKNFSCSKDLFLMRHPASKSNSRSVCPRPPGGGGGGGGGFGIYIIPPVYAIALSCIHVRGNYCKDKVETDLANRNPNEW